MNVHSRAPSPILTLAYWNKIDCSMTALTKFWNSLSRILSPSDREVSGVQRFAKNPSLRGSTSSKFIKWIMHTRTMSRSRYWRFESHLFLVDAFDMEWCVVYNIVALLNVYILMFFKWEGFLICMGYRIRTKSITCLICVEHRTKWTFNRQIISK